MSGHLTPEERLAELRAAAQDHLHAREHTVARQHPDPLAGDLELFVRLSFGHLDEGDAAAASVTPSVGEVADAVDRAASHLEQVGLHKGGLYDEEQAVHRPVGSCRVDVYGAINMAVYGAPRYPVHASPHAPVARLAEWWLCAHLGLEATPRSPWSDTPLAQWNDAPERTQVEAVQAMRDTATHLRGEAA